MSDTTLCTRTCQSPLGALVLVASDAGLRAILWPGDRPDRVPLAAEALESSDHPVLREAVSQLGEYFAGERTSFDLPLDPEGTPFQRSVWTALADIPFGVTVSYGEIAERVGRQRGAARAIGAAVGRNPLSIVLPCHRVIGADGSLTGFAAGLETKLRLLEHEQAVLPI